MFDAEKAKSEFRKENMYGKKEDQETTKGKVLSNKISDEYRETNPEAIKKNWGFIAGKANQIRTEEIEGYLEEDKFEYNKKVNLIYTYMWNVWRYWWMPWNFSKTHEGKLLFCPKCSNFIMNKN